MKNEKEKSQNDTSKKDNKSEKKSPDSLLLRLKRRANADKK